MALNTNLMATAKGDVMICDHDLHASLVDGALRSVARVMRFRHNDLDHFERCLNNCASEEKILVVSEGVFSMEGDLAELHGLVNLSKSNAARIYVDEAHRLGVLGRTGRSRGSGRSWITGHSEVIHMDAVGTIITDRPPHRSVRALLRIRLPPWMSGEEAHDRIRMQNTWGWKPPREDR